MDTFKIVKSDNPLEAEVQSQDIVVTHKGRKYKILSIVEEKYNFTERTGRLLLGGLCTIATLGLALLFKPVRDLLTKDSEWVRHGMLIPTAPLPASQLPSALKVKESNKQLKVKFAEENDVQYVMTIGVHTEKEKMKTEDGDTNAYQKKHKERSVEEANNSLVKSFLDSLGM